MGTITICRHHWVIETADGPTSKGRCRRCHETKDFQNGTPDGNAIWGNTDPVVIKSRYRGNLKLARREP